MKDPKDDIVPNNPIDKLGTEHRLKMANRASQKIGEMEANEFARKEAKILAAMHSDRPVLFRDELVASYHAINTQRLRNRERKIALDAGDEALLRNTAKRLQSSGLNAARRDNTDVR